MIRIKSKNHQESFQQGKAVCREPKRAMQNLRSGAQGFTLVEAMMVVVVAGVLASMGFQSVRKAARENLMPNVRVIVAHFFADAQRRAIEDNRPVAVDVVGNTLRSFYWDDANFDCNVQPPEIVDIGGVPGAAPIAVLDFQNLDIDGVPPEGLSILNGKAPAAVATPYDGLFPYTGMCREGGAYASTVAVFSGGTGAWFNPLGEACWTNLAILTSDASFSQKVQYLEITPLGTVLLRQACDDTNNLCQ